MEQTKRLEIEVIYFDNYDVICTSDGPDDGGDF